jgi:hypothetical protein
MTAPAQIGHVEAQARGTGPDHPTYYEQDAGNRGWGLEGRRRPRAYRP